MHEALFHRGRRRTGGGAGWRWTVPRRDARRIAAAINSHRQGLIGPDDEVVDLDLSDRQRDRLRLVWRIAVENEIKVLAEHFVKYGRLGWEGNSPTVVMVQCYGEVFEGLTTTYGGSLNYSTWKASGESVYRFFNALMPTLKALRPAKAKEIEDRLAEVEISDPTLQSILGAPNPFRALASLLSEQALYPPARIATMLREAAESPT